MSMLEARRAILERYEVDACTTECSLQSMDFEQLLDRYADAVRQKAIADCQKAIRDNVDPRALEHS